MADSAGILMYRRRGGELMVLLVHPGGPYWRAKDLGAWSIPKGEFLDDEARLDAARREFAEEMGQAIEGAFVALTPCKQPSRKVVHAFAIEGDLDAAAIRSNDFEMEWPPKSGRMQSFPEIDRAVWFDLAEARRRIQKGQLPILEELVAKLTRDRE